MKSRIVTVVGEARRVFTALFCPVFLAVAAQAGHAATLNVPADYTTIGGAIHAASSGDTVLVANGTYTGYANREMNFAGKTLTVKSVGGAANCVIDCQQMAALSIS